jgi:DNA-binding IclR family transcriptional regulator
METVLLARRTGNAAMYIEMVESQQSLRYIVKVGDVRPLHGTAVGLALLAAMPLGDREIMIGKLRLERRTKATITTRTALQAAIDKGLARGWFMTQGDYFEEISAMAKAICIEGETYAVVVAGPVERMARKRKQHAEALLSMHRWVQDVLARPSRTRA